MMGMDSLAMGTVGDLDGSAHGNTDGTDDAARKQQDGYRKAMAQIRAGASAIEDDDDERLYGNQNTGNTSHPNYRPPKGEKTPGLTDKRFDGYIHFWHQEQGYGFIKSQQLSKRFPNHDIFLHKNQKGRFEEGDQVSFGVFFNYRGKPQATELQKPKGGSTE